MSLLLSPSLKCSTYIFGSSGDINPDPMRESLPRKDHQNSHNNQEHVQSALPDLEVTFKDVKPAVPIVLPVARVKTLERSKEYTTKDKILQVQNGEFILNTLKSNKKFTGEPQQMTSSEIRKALNTNYKKHHDGTLEMINQHLLKRQKQVLGFLVKKFGSALFKGKSMSNISLPVTVFESQSQLEREVRSLCYAPHFLEKGGSTTDTLEQFKLALTQFISTLHLETTPQKAFIPTLGETFQGIIGDCPVYVEQISCHPAKYALQMLGKNFTMEEVSEFATHMSINSVKSYKIGKLKVIYKNNKTVIRAQLPPGLTSGIAMGKRTFQVTDKCYVFDIENKYYAEISFDSSESSLFKRRHKHTKDQFSGAIWKINDSFADKLSQAVTHHYDLADVKFKEKDHVVAKLEDIEGSWLESLKIGDRLYWSFGDILPFKLQYAENPLPSDSNFRLDILHLRANDEVKSETYKEMLEENQRKDSKLREQSQRKAIKP